MAEQGPRYLPTPEEVEEMCRKIREEKENNPHESLRDLNRPSTMLGPKVPKIYKTPRIDT